MSYRLTLLGIAALISGAGWALPVAEAGLVSFGGSAVPPRPPANINLGMWESDTEARVWTERSTVLTSDLAVNAVNTGVVWQNGSGNTPGTIAAPTSVTSYMLRTDPVADNTDFFSGFLIFDQPILGLIFFKGKLDLTDALLGRPGISYNTNTDRGLETNAIESLTLSFDRLRLDFDFRTEGATDDVRIITAVPAPTMLAGVPAANVAWAVRRRRRATLH